MPVAGPRKSPAFDWTEERTATAVKLWKGGHSASQIATRLGGGISRNAVVGKMHRLGLSGGNKLSPLPGQARVQPAKAPRTQRATKPSRPPDPNAKPPTPVPEPPEPSKPSLDLDLADLEPGQCKFPFGDLPYRFCGHPVTERGEPYCAEHHRLCRPPLTATQRQGAKGLVRALRRYL